MEWSHKLVFFSIIKGTLQINLTGLCGFILKEMTDRVAGREEKHRKARTHSSGPSQPPLELLAARRARVLLKQTATQSCKCGSIHLPYESFLLLSMTFAY